MAIDRGSDTADQGSPQAGPGEQWPGAGTWLGIVGVALGLALHFSPLDQSLLLLAHRLNRLPDDVWLFITQLGDSALVLSLLLCAAGRCPWRRALTLKVWLLGAVTSPVLKSLWDTPRPLAVLDPAWLHTVGQPPGGHHAMPSGHSMAAAALATVLLVFGARRHGGLSLSLSLFLAALALLIGLSRVVVGAHWPGDVLTGLGLGVLTVMLARAWEQRQPWASRLGSAWADVLLSLLQGVLALVLWQQHSEGPGMALASSAGMVLAAVCLLRLWIDRLAIFRGRRKG